MENKYNEFQAINKIVFNNNSTYNIFVYWFRYLSNEISKYAITSANHHHTFFEIHIMLNGSMTYLFEEQNKEICIKKNEFFIIIPYQKHKIINKSKDFIKLALAFSLTDGHPLDLPLRSAGLKPTHINKQLQNNISFIKDQAFDNSDYSSFVIKNRIIEMICFIAGHIKIQKKGCKDNYINDSNGHLLRAKKFIDDNSHIFLSCDDVANNCHLSVKHLGRIFKKYENKSLLTYIHETKINQAKDLLRENLTIKDVSTKIGFANEYYFNTFFKKYTGISPGVYRNLHIKKVN